MAALLIRFIVWCISLLPLGISRQLGKWMGCFLSQFDFETTRVTRINVQRCFPALTDLEHDNLVLKSLQHTAMLVMEFGMLWYWSLERCRTLWQSVDGYNLVEGALQEKRGVLILVPHFGNWEVLSLHLGKSGYTCLYDRPRIAGLEKVIVDARSRTGGRLVPIGTAGIKTIVKALRNGEIVALLPDQVPDANAGVYAPLFGHPALTMTLAQRLLKLSGAVPMLGAAVRTERGFTICYQNVPEEVGNADSVVAATALNQMTETLIRKDPAQYQWEYRRFKRQPVGVSPVYPRKTRDDL